MIDWGTIASYLRSLLSKIIKLEHTSQSKLVRDPDSSSVSDVLINQTIPVTLYNNLLTFRDTAKTFELQGYRSKMMTNKNYSVDLLIYRMEI